MPTIPIRAALATFDRRAWGAAALAGLAVLLAYGLVAAIIPNPVFGRQIPPEPFAIATWLISAPLMGLLAATYLPLPAGSVAIPLAASSDVDRGGTGATVGSVAAFLAIGCPVCNKVAVLLLGTSGAMSIFAPLQPLIGAAALVLLAGTLAWRLRLRARGGACRLPAAGDA